MTATPTEIARRALADHLANLPPAELLARFAANRDADAFASLVHQFGPCVLGVCRRVLGSSADADDAFQAVFLALARQAGSFRDAAALPAWLHRVALRVARKALARRERIAAIPDSVTDPADPFAEIAWKDVRHVLDEELDALPLKLRGPVVLCWLDGLTQDEAATRLGLSLSTLKRRLGAGRERLRTRLLRRGVAPVLAASAVRGPTALRADVPFTLANAVARAAATVSPVATSVTRQVALIALAAVAAGGLAMVSARNAPQPEAAPQPAPVVVRAEPEATTVPLPPGAVARFGSAQFRGLNRIAAAALSPDGKVLALADAGRVRLFDPITWKQLAALDASEGDYLAESGRQLAFSRDGKYLSYSKCMQFVFVWEIGSSKRTCVFDGGEMWRWTCPGVFTPDGLLSMADKNRLYFYDPVSGREVRSVKADKVMMVSPDGKYFVRPANGDNPESLVLGDVKSGKVLHKFDAFLRRSNGLSFSPDSKRLTLAPANGTELQVWDIPTLSLIEKLKTPKGGDLQWRFGPVAGFSPDGRELWFKMPDGDIARWDAATYKELPRLVTGGEPRPDWLIPLPDGKTLLAPCESGWVRVWDAATGKEKSIPGRYRTDAVLALAPDGKLVAVADASGRVDLLDAANGKPVKTLRESGEPVRYLVFSPDSALLVVGELRYSADRSKMMSRVVVLRASDGKVMGVRGTKEEGDSQSASGLIPLGFAAADDGDNLIVDYYPREARIWNIGTGKESVRLASKNLYPVPSPDGRLLLTEDFGEAVLLDTATGRETKRIEIDADDKSKKRVDELRKFAWSGDGRTVAVSLSGEHVCILDPAIGKERKRFKLDSIDLGDRVKLEPFAREGRQARALALSPDGKRLVAAILFGKYVALWDTQTGKQLVRLEHDIMIDRAVFTPDGKSVITFGSTGLGYRWDIERLIAARKE